MEFETSMGFKDRRDKSVKHRAGRLGGVSRLLSISAL